MRFRGYGKVTFCEPPRTKERVSRRKGRAAPLMEIRNGGGRRKAPTVMGTDSAARTGSGFFPLVGDEFKICCNELLVYGYRHQHEEMKQEELEREKPF